MMASGQGRAIGGAERARLVGGDRVLGDLMPVVVALARAALGGSRNKSRAAVRRLGEQLLHGLREGCDADVALGHAAAEVEALLDAQPAAGEIPVERATRHDAIEAMRRRGGLDARQVRAANALQQTWEAQAVAGSVAAQALVAKVDGGAGAESVQVAKLAADADAARIEQAWSDAITGTQRRIALSVLRDRLTLSVAAVREGVRKQDAGVALRAALTCYAEIAGFPAAVKGYD